MDLLGGEEVGVRLLLLRCYCAMGCCDDIAMFSASYQLLCPREALTLMFFCPGYGGCMTGLGVGVCT